MLIKHIPRHEHQMNVWDRWDSVGQLFIGLMRVILLCPMSHRYKTHYKNRDTYRAPT